MGEGTEAVVDQAPKSESVVNNQIELIKSYAEKKKRYNDIPDEALSVYGYKKEKDE